MATPERFVKRAPPAQLTAELHGLRWLAAAGAVTVVEILDRFDDRLELAFVESRAPSTTDAEAFGRDLADLHAASAEAFGAPWPGFIGPLPLANDPTQSFLEFYVGRRVLPFLAQARDRGAVSAEQAAVIEAACRAGREPARAPEPHPR